MPAGVELPGYPTLLLFTGAETAVRSHGRDVEGLAAFVEAHVGAAAGGSAGGGEL